MSESSKEPDPNAEKITDASRTAAILRKLAWLDQHKAIDALTVSSDPLAETVLFLMLDWRAPSVREAALNALMTRKETLGRIAARAMLDDANFLVRNAAAEILGLVGDRQDIRRLRRALEDENWVMRATVADSLGQVGGKAVHPALLHVLTHDPHPVVRRDAAYALSYARSREVVPPLEQALATEKAEQAQVGLLSALVALGCRERLPDLLNLLASEDDSVRHSVIYSLQEIVGPEEREQTIQAIRTLLEHEVNPAVKGDAESALAEISGTVSID